MYLLNEDIKKKLKDGARKILITEQLRNYKRGYITQYCTCLRICGISKINSEYGDLFKIRIIQQKNVHSKNFSKNY